MKKFKAFLLIILLSFSQLLAETGEGVSEVGTLSSIAVGIEDENTTPVEYFLNQNYPNPFNPSTEISFSLAKSSFVIMEIYNSLGQKVAALLNKNIDPGRHKVKFNASNLSSGIYYYKIQAGEFQSVKKMLLIQ
jgi:hypothetical protein